LIPQHVVIRGVDGQPCFRTTGDYASYLDDLAHARERYGCELHAYALMTNHVHLLVTPAVAGAVSRMMQCIGHRYVQRFNAAWDRTGHLFEGRFRSSLVESSRYLLNCMRYIECNPVRAAMVRHPADYPWSSFRANAALASSGLVTPADEYLALAADPLTRASFYRRFVEEATQDGELQLIRTHLNANCALGGDAFQAEMAQQCGRRAAVRRTGRPAGSADARPRRRREASTAGRGLALDNN
jgi:putative transposase